jgi:hypothetical protein
MGLSNKVIVSWASKGREDYNAAQLKLIRSCKDAQWNGDYLMRTLDGYCDEYMGVPIIQGSNPLSVKWPLVNSHFEIPYAFKPTAIQECREKGYESVIWMDSSMRLLKDPQQYLDYAAQYGVCSFENLGHPWRNYVTDIAVQKTGVKDNELDKVINIMACCLVFDFSNPVAALVFDEWIELAHDGFSFHNGYDSIRPEYIAHRHDQAVLAALLYKHKVPILPYGGLAYHPHQIDNIYGEVTFLNHGVN